MSLPLLITNIMHALFLSLKDDSLIFLMGIVVRSLDVIEERGMCFAALCHATAFLAAHPNVDFQTILPALTIAMQGADSRAGIFTKDQTPSHLLGKIANARKC
jgi:U3 small nucleolar RNA-associated protein 10